MPRHTETIAALATPAGTSAIAVVRVSGPDIRRLVRDIFGAVPPPRIATHADLIDREGALLDDVLFTFFEEPRSYTGEDSLEISCHGNPFVAQKIVEDLIDRGCRPAEPGEFTRRAFLNGRMDLSRAEAVMDLIHARSDRAIMMANSQLRGSLGRRMRGLVDDLLGVLSRIEAYIDFPEEDLPPEDFASLTTALQGLSRETERLLATSHYGALLRDGIKTVIVGAPNAGKSSLLNQLVGSERALVSPEPGTTRDFIEERIIIGPHCLRLIDTAGLNPTPGNIESLGIKKTYERMEEADLVLFVFDATCPALTPPPVIADLSSRPTTVIVLNKCDLLPYVPPVVLPGGAETVQVSALTGEGLDRLRDVIVRFADSFQTEVGVDSVAVSARHAQALGRARVSLEMSLAQLKAGSAMELLASELREVLDAYGEIIGKVDNEQMLDKLFATFCIGK